MKINSTRKDSLAALSLDVHGDRTYPAMPVKVRERINEHLWNSLPKSYKIVAEQVLETELGWVVVYSVYGYYNLGNREVTHWPFKTERVAIFNRIGDPAGDLIIGNHEIVETTIG